MKIKESEPKINELKDHISYLEERIKNARSLIANILGGEIENAKGNLKKQPGKS